MSLMTLNLLTRIQQRLAEFESTSSEELRHVTVGAERLLNATVSMRTTWSGSFAGWHSTMYFGDFDRPAVHEMFDGEWGGYHGVPDGWFAKTLEQVEANLDERVGDGFSSKAFDRQVDRLRQQIKDVADDVGLLIAQLPVPTLPKATHLLAQIENATFADGKGRYVNENTPNNLWSRDSEAVRQGMLVPDWLYYQAVAVSATSLTSTFVAYMKNVRRLMGFVGDMKNSPASSTESLGLQGLPLHPAIVEKCDALYQAGEYAEAVEKSFKMVRDRLRTLTGHETGSKAFGTGKLHIRGAAASNVDFDFNEAVKFLCMAIDNFRNEKSHTSDARIADPVRAQQYLGMSSLALSLLEEGEVPPP